MVGMNNVRTAGSPSSAAGLVYPVTHVAFGRAAADSVLTLTRTVLAGALVMTGLLAAAMVIAYTVTYGLGMLGYDPAVQY